MKQMQAMHAWSWFPTLMLLLITGDELKVTWTPHPDNTELRINYSCAKDAHNPPFLAVNVWDITPTQAETSVRRVATPNGQKCMIGAYIMRTPPTGRADEDSLSIGEWRILLHIENGADEGSI